NVTLLFLWLALELRDRRQSVFDRLQQLDLGGGASIATFRRYRRHHRRGRRSRSCGPAASGPIGAVGARYRAQGVVYRVNGVRVLFWCSFAGISCVYARNAGRAQIWYFDPCAVGSQGAMTMDQRRFMALIWCSNVDRSRRARNVSRRLFAIWFRSKRM